MKRIYSIDFVRGFVMVIMALDHVRDMTHVNSLTQSPTNLTTTTPALFFTRWITYLCAPTFVFLAGSSAYLSFKNKPTVSESSIFLLKRGIWLVLLEFTIVNFGLFADPGFHTVIFEVIATIGFGFIVLSFLLKASTKTIAIIGLLIIFLHDLFPLISFAENSVLKNIVTPFFSLNVFPINAQRIFLMAYPPIPWLGIMLVGFATGKLFEKDLDMRKSIFFKIGVSALVLFIILRFINVYGDPAIWAKQKNTAYTFLSYMNISKYPPSLLFTLIALGIMFVMLSFAENANKKITAILSVYGKVPLFYFIVHFYFAHLLVIIMLYCQGFHWADFSFATGTFGRPKDVPSGVPLWGVYLIWVFVVVVLYKPCAWFGRYKSSHKYWWLKYI